MNPETVAYESLRIGDMRFAYHRAGHGGVPIVLLHGGHKHHGLGAG